MKACYLVVLDLAESAYHPHTMRLGRSYSGDSDDWRYPQEWALTYAALEAGQYVIEGGYPCGDDKCPERRHPPLAIKKTCDENQPFGRWVWTCADPLKATP